MKPMTVTTRAMYHAATSRTLTVQEAVAMLKNEMKPRSLPDKLERFAKGRELRPLLVEGMSRNHPDKKRDSMERKVRDWYSGKDRAIRKEDALELCFILQLSVEEADELLSLITEEGFHWRTPEEIVFAYALKKGMTYPDACALNERMQHLICPANDAASPAADSFTAVVRTEVASLDTEEQLADYLLRSHTRLGRFHNTAYSFFMDCMSLLEDAQIADGLEDTKAMSTRDVVEQYFFRRLIPRVKRSSRDPEGKSLSAIQRSIWANWPEEVAISRMKNRTADVTRKVIILLFIATDGGMDDEDDTLLDEDREFDFEDVYTRLNDTLSYCGFSALDPRAPFDWMMLYCMCAEDLFDVDMQMESFLGTLFADGDA